MAGKLAPPLPQPLLPFFLKPSARLRRPRRRQEGGRFRLTVPLGELLGVDLTPQIQVEARSAPSAGSVTLLGTRAALGSPEIDSSFRLYLVAVLSQQGGAGPGPAVTAATAAAGASGSGGEPAAGAAAAPPPAAGAGGGGPLARLRRRHLPGRPVARLRKLVARARGVRGRPPPDSAEWEAWAAGHLPSLSFSEDEVLWEPPAEAASQSGGGSSSSSGGGSSSLLGPEEQGEPGQRQQQAGWPEPAGAAVHNGVRRAAPQPAAAGAAAASLEASGRMTGQPAAGSSNSSSTGSGSGSEELAADEWPAESGQLYFNGEGPEAGSYPAGGSTSGGSAAAALPSSAAERQHNEQQQQQQDEEGEGEGPQRQPQLRCQVSVRVAVRVPPFIRAVPNWLLGYSGGFALLGWLRLLLRSSWSPEAAPD